MKITNIHLRLLIRETVLSLNESFSHEPNTTLEIAHANVNGIPIKVQIADDDDTRKKGLMFRQSLPKDEGMLFIHDVPEICGYYMKNTYMPLSIAYADQEGVIFQIENMQPGDLNSVMSIQPAFYVLETNQGWFDDNNLQIGAQIEY